MGHAVWGAVAGTVLGCCVGLFEVLATVRALFWESDGWGLWGCCLERAVRGAGVQSFACFSLSWVYAGVLFFFWVGAILKQTEAGEQGLVGKERGGGWVNMPHCCSFSHHMWALVSPPFASDLSMKSDFLQTVHC